jgi:hypothetical protein
MNTQDFYDKAIDIAKEFGIEKPNVTTSSGCYNGSIKHSCSIYIHDKRIIISSELHNNPVSALLAFKDAIEFKFKEYNQETKSIEA